MTFCSNSKDKEKNIPREQHINFNFIEIFGLHGMANCFDVFIRGCQIGMQGPQLCAEPCHFCKLDVATSRIAFFNLNLHVLQVAPSNSKN